MQYDPSKQGYNNNYANQYPPPPQFGGGNVYPPNNAPPPYAPYPQQPGGYPAPGVGYPGQTPLYQQQGYVVAPVYRPWNNLLSVPITSSLKTFLVLSGIFYLIWGIMALGLGVGIILNSYSTYYNGVWAGGFLIGGGISMLIASCRASYVILHLLRLYIVTLCLSILALILSIVNLTITYRCNSGFHWYSFCDSTLAVNLKIVTLVLFIVTIIHTIVNMVVISNAQKRAQAAATTNIPNRT